MITGPVLRLFFSIDYVESVRATGVLLGNLYSFVTMILIYLVGKSLVTSIVKAKYSALYFLVFGASMYQLAFQTESLFSLLFLFGIYVMT